jgi:dihydrofolate reductase
MTSRYLYYTAMTLDGYLADEHDSLDWLFVQPIDEEGPMNYTSFIADIGALAMGATTYRWLVDHQKATNEPWPYEIPSFVYTHGEPALIAGSIKLADGSPSEHRDAIEEAAAGKDVWVVGGGDLAAQFATDGMLDEIIVSIAPVTLGAGRPLFTRPYDLELIELDRNRAFACARYRVVGPRPAQ